MSQLAETVIKRHHQVWGTNLGGRIILIVEHMRNKLAQIIPSFGYRAGLFSICLSLLKFLFMNLVTDLFHYRQDKTTVLIW